MENLPNQFVISIMSRDRIGIVYDVSSAISELNGNIADIRQSVLCSYFTMILLACFPETVSRRAIEQKLAGVDARSEIAIHVAVKQVEDSIPPDCHPGYPQNTYVLTAIGTDQIGFVAAVTSFCVDHRLNILDLSTTIMEGEYLMVLLLDTGQVDSLSDLRQDLRDYAQKTQIKLVLQHYDIFKAVNEINLPVI